MTDRETSLSEHLRDLQEAVRPFAELMATTNGRIPVERLSLADWHTLAKAYVRSTQTTQGDQP